MVCHSPSIKLFLPLLLAALLSLSHDGTARKVKKQAGASPVVKTPSPQPPPLTASPPSPPPPSPPSPSPPPPTLPPTDVNVSGPNIENPNTTATPPPTFGMPYHGGAVMTDPINIYILWLGNFTDGQKNLVRSFLSSINDQDDSPGTVAGWWGVSTKYFDSTGSPVSSQVNLAGEYTMLSASQLQYDSERHIQVLTGVNGIQALLDVPLGNGQWTADNNGVYVMITDESILQASIPSFPKWSFCSNYCGFHSAYGHTPRGKRSPLSLKYIWVGMASLICPKQCIAKYYNYPDVLVPSEDRGIHGVVNMLAHELSETATNPTMGGWYRGHGVEDADMCSWQFNGLKTIPAPRRKRVVYNLAGTQGSKFLVQSLWDPTWGGCSSG